MAHPQIPIPPAGIARQQVEPPPVGLAAPPTFLERWGVILLACAGAWVLLVASIVVYYYLQHQPQFPAVSTLAPDQMREALSLHKEQEEQFRDSLVSIFDLAVTRTVLPIVTLLLGYLFGKNTKD